MHIHRVSQSIRLYHPTIKTDIMIDVVLITRQLCDFYTESRNDILKAILVKNHQLTTEGV